MPKPLSHNGLVILRLRQSKPRETYAGLLHVKADKGYSIGWVAHKFKEIFGGWPRPQAAVEPQEPSEDLREWLGIERRRYRARMKRIEKRDLARNVTPFAANVLPGTIPGVEPAVAKGQGRAAGILYESSLMQTEDWDVKL